MLQFEMKEKGNAKLVVIGVGGGGCGGNGHDWAPFQQRVAGEHLLTWLFRWRPFGVLQVPRWGFRGVWAGARPGILKPVSEYTGRALPGGYWNLNEFSKSSLWRLMMGIGAGGSILSPT